MIKITDKFSSCRIFSFDILVINLLFITSMIDSLSIKNQLIWIFSIHVIMNIEVISSSFFNASAIILDVFNMTLLIAFFIKTMIFAANFLTRYLEIDRWRFQTNFFRNCWLSLSNCSMNRLIIKFIIFWTSNRLLFFMIRIRSRTFSFLNVINFFICSLIILIFVLLWFLFLDVCFFDIVTDSFFEYFIISSLSCSSSKSWNFFDWFNLDISSTSFIFLNSAFFSEFSEFFCSYFCFCCFRYLSCFSFIRSFFLNIVLFFLIWAVIFFFRISSLLVVATITWSNNTHSARLSCLSREDKMTCAVIRNDFISLNFLELRHSLA